MLGHSALSEAPLSTLVSSGPPAQTLSPSAVASMEAFGTAALSLHIQATGLATSEAFGTSKITLYLLPSAIASGEAIGSHSLAILISPSGVASLESLPSPVVTGPISVSGIVTGEAFGTSVVTGPISVTAITSSEALGTHSVSANTIVLTGIASDEAVGTLILAGPITATSIASSEAIGALTVRDYDVAVLDYVRLVNSDSSLDLRFRVTRPDGYLELPVRASDVNRTVTGDVDVVIGATKRMWRLNMKVRETETDANYGSLPQLRTMYAYNNPFGTPSDLLTFYTPADTAYSVTISGDLTEKPRSPQLTGSNAWYDVGIVLEEE